MINSTIPKEYKHEFMKEAILKKYSIVDTGNIVVIPEVVLTEVALMEAVSLVLKLIE